MLLIRRRISLMLFIVTLLSLIPRADVSAMPRGLDVPAAEAHLAPLAPAAAPVRPVDARSTDSVTPSPVANLPAALPPPPSLRFELHAIGNDGVSLKVQTPAGVVIGSGFSPNDPTGGFRTATTSYTPPPITLDQSVTWADTTPAPLGRYVATVWEYSTPHQTEPTGSYTFKAYMDGILVREITAPLNTSVNPSFTGETEIIIDTRLLPSDQFPGKCDCMKAGDPTEVAGDPVDTFTLAFIQSGTDMTVPSAGPALTFSRTYVSMFADPTKYPVSTLGPGWRHAFEAQLTFAGSIGGEPNTIILEDPSGSRLRFFTTGTTTETGPGGVSRTVYPAFRGIYAKLTKDAGSTAYVLTNRDGSLQIFNASGKLTEQRDPQGRRQTLTYFNTPSLPQHGQLQEVKDLTTARTLTFTYGQSTLSNGQLSRVYLSTVKNQLNHTVQFTYYDSGTVLTPLYQTIAAGTIRSTYQYVSDLGSNGYWMTGVQYSNRDIVTNMYVNGRISMQGDAAGMLTTYTQSVTTANTTTTVKTTNGSGSVVYDTIQYIYRPDGTLDRKTHDNQSQGTIRFDPTTLVPVQQVDANGNTTASTNNRAGLPTTITQPNGAVTTLSYTSDNLPTTIVGADGTTIQLTYNAAKNVTKLVRYATSMPSLSQTTYYTYTPDLLRLEYLQTPDRVVTKYAYDTLGQRTDVTVGFGKVGAITTHTVYDVLGRPTDVTAAYGTSLATTTHTDYNQDHQVTKVTRNYQGTGVYNALYPDRNVWTEYGYDTQSRRIWTREVDGHYTSYTFYNSSTGTVDWEVKNPVNASGVPTLPTTSTPPAFSPARPDANVATLYQYNQQGLMTLSTQTGILTGTFNTSTRQFSGATTIATRIEYDGLNRPVTTTLNYRPGESVTAERNIPTYTYYDAVGNVTWQSDELGRWNKTEYDALNRVQRAIQNYQDGTIDSLDLHADTDLITVNQYNPLGQLELVTENYIDGQTQFATINGAMTITEGPNDRVTRYGYDLLGRPTTTTTNYLNQANVSNGNYVTTTRYDGTTGRVVATQDLLGQWDAPVYDERGRTLSIIRNCRTAAGAVVPTGAPDCAALTTAHPDRNVPTPTSTYDALGRVMRTTDVLAVITHTTFDGLSRPVARTANFQYDVPPAADVNVKTTTTYLNGAATVWQVTDPTNRVTSYQANALGQTITITDTAGLVTRVGYDSTGHRWHRTPAGVFTVTRVDNLGRPVATIENYENGMVDAADGTTRDLTTSTRLDAGGRMVERTNPAGEVTRFSYDLRDQLVQVIEGVKTVCPTYALANADCNLVTRYAYDWGGNQTSVINARAYTRYLGYGTRGELLWTRNELGTLTDNRRYDRAGRLTRTDVNDTFAVNTYGYDELSRQTSRNGQSWTYDAAGRTMSFTDPAAASPTYAKTGALSYGYDGLNRVIQTESSLDGDPASGLTTTPYGYDAAGRVTTVGGTNYTYDTAGRPSLIKRGKTLIGEHIYDSYGRPVVFTQYDNGVAVTGSTTSYDAAQRVQGIQSVKVTTNAILADFTATYDRADRVTTAMQRTTSSAGATVTANLSYSYDLVGRLMTEVQGSTTTDYRYDAAGNRTLVRVNGTTIQSRTYNAANQVGGWSYDTIGRLTNDGTSTYGYDAFDRLTSIVQGGTTTTLAYHGESLVAKYVGGVRKFGYEHNTVTGAHSSLLRIHDFQTAGVTSNTTYAYTQKGQGFWSEQTTNGALSQIFLFGDQLGTVRQTYNPDAAASNRQDTDVWGRPTGTQVSALRFAGEFQDAQSGLVFLRARWYNPTNGTFLTRDPFAGQAEQPYSLHAYQYGYSDPVTNTDPSGRCPTCAAAGAVGGGVGAAACVASLVCVVGLAIGTAAAVVVANEYEIEISPPYEGFIDQLPPDVRSIASILAVTCAQALLWWQSINQTIDTVVVTGVDVQTYQDAAITSEYLRPLLNGDYANLQGPFTRSTHRGFKLDLIQAGPVNIADGNLVMRNLIQVGDVNIAIGNGVGNNLTQIGRVNITSGNIVASDLNQVNIAGGFSGINWSSFNWVGRDINQTGFN